MPGKINIIKNRQYHPIDPLFYLITTLVSIISIIIFSNPSASYHAKRWT